MSTPRKSAATKQSATEAASSADKPFPVSTAVAKARALDGEILPLRWGASSREASMIFWVVTESCSGMSEGVALASLDLNLCAVVTMRYGIKSFLGMPDIMSQAQEYCFYLRGMRAGRPLEMFGEPKGAQRSGAAEKTIPTQFACFGISVSNHAGN